MPDSASDSSIRSGGSSLASSALVSTWAAWAGLLILSRFLWTKIAFNTEGTGWLLLPMFGVCLAVVIVARFQQGERLLQRGSCTWAAMFLAYFVVRLAFDSQNLGDFVGYTLGYANGVLFGYGLGLASRVMVDAAVHVRGRVVRYMGVAVFLSFNTLSAWQLERSAIDVGEADLFRAHIRNDTYQVSGALISVIAVLAAAVAVHGKRSVTPSREKWIEACVISMTVVLIAISAQLAQLIGSNAGPAFLLPLAVIVCAIALTPFDVRLPTFSSKPPVTRPSHLLWRRARTAMAISFALAVAIASLFWICVNAEVVDITRYRFFGFDEATVFNSSLMSRVSIFSSNYGVQLGFAPVFGYFFVDRATTGDGTYAHSLVAIIPHLGVIGACTFIAMGFAMARQLVAAWNRACEQSNEQRFLLLSMAVVAWAAVFLLMTNFFTSILLWFPLGLFVPAMQIARPPRAP
jgi:hypothetical protein